MVHTIIVYYVGLILRPHPWDNRGMFPRTLRSIIVLAVLTAAGVGLSFAGRTPHTPTQGRMSVTASFYPMAEIAKAVGGDAVSVSTLVPAGSEPHDFEPSPTDIAAISSSRVFLYNGAGFESWVGHVAAATARSGVKLVDASEGLPLIRTSDRPPVVDPHTWLDPVLAASQTASVRDAFIAADPGHADGYRARAATYIAALEGLDADYRHRLSRCDKRDIVTSHDASGYLARRYGFTAHPIAGLSPEDEPSPARIAELTQMVRDLGIGYVFFETLASPKIAETIAAETGAKALVFNPIEGVTIQERRSGTDYMSLSRDNLTNLARALMCHE